MANVPVPFVNRTLSTDDPFGAVLTVILLVIGFAVFFLAADLGESVKRTGSQTLGVGSESGQNRPNIL